jgi:glycosyltransferase involved in cell wall biosynthesis
MVGGPQISLINLLNSIDKTKYDITLLLFRTGGLLLNEVPDYVKIRYVWPKGLFSHFNDNKLNFLLWLPFRGFIELYILLLDKVFNKNTEIRWSIKKHFVKKIKNEYDVAIGYMERTPIYFVVDKVNSDVKIGRIPTDYKTARLNSKFDEYYFNKLKYLFVVSKHNGEILADVFPKVKDRIRIFESIISPKIVHEKAKQGIGFNDNFNGVRIFTMARLHTTKGIELAIEACANLVENGYRIRWYFMGSGNKNYYKNYIKEKEISEFFHILEPNINPLPFLKQADIYVQPSLYEGKSNAVNEAKALYKPIVITNFSTAPDHIVNNVNGLIVDVSSKKIAEAISILIENKNLQNRLSDNLKQNFRGNKDSVIKEFYKLVDC